MMTMLASAPKPAEKHTDYDARESEEQHIAGKPDKKKNDSNGHDDDRAEDWAICW